MSFAEALDAYRSGRLIDACEEIADDCSMAARLLYVAIHARLRNSSNLFRAIEIAAEIRNSDAHIQDKIQVCLYESFVQARVGNLQAAALAIREAYHLIGELPSLPASLESEFSIVNALILFMQGSLDAAERQAWNAVYADLDLEYRDPPLRAPLVPIDVTKARALILIGVIRGKQERYHEEYRYLREAMVKLRQSPIMDVWTAAIIRLNRAAYARDLGMLGEIIELEMIPHEWWPADLADLQIEVARSLSYLYALSGRDDLAIEGFASAAMQAKSPANRLLLIADEAYVARQHTTPRVLRSRLLAACAVADEVDWESIHTERYALHAFAQELAFVSPSRALAFLKRYSALDIDSNPTEITGKRAAAEAKYSEGVVAAANGDRDRAIETFFAAFEIWRDVGFRWRATAAALEIAEITNDPGLMGYVLRETQQYPNSWLARRALTLGRQAS